KVLACLLPNYLHQGMLQQSERDCPALAGFGFAVAETGDVCRYAEAVSRFLRLVIGMEITAANDELNHGGHLRRSFPQCAEVLCQRFMRLERQARFVSRKNHVNVGDKLSSRPEYFFFG